MDQNRKSSMEPAEGSRETALDNERMSSGRGESGERMRNRESSSGDLGSTSDRAMMTGPGSEARNVTSDPGMGPPSSPGMTSERGQGSSGELNRGSSGSSRRSGNTGGITNRGLDREQSEQEQLPERGRSQSER